MKTRLAKLLILSIIVNGGLSITLDGRWTGRMRYCGKTTTEDCANEITFPASVPGGIYTDLENANVIQGNLFGDNDVRHRWIGNQTVTYTRNFHADHSILSARRLVLVFHGLDTFATIYLNDHKVGETRNMFTRHTFDVNNYIEAGDNLLKVVFASPIKTANTLYDKQSKDYIVPPVCVPNDYNGECHVNHIRKMQASFAWDWGPAFPSMGIWRSVELIPVHDFVITEVTTDVRKNLNTWTIDVTVFVQTVSRTDGALTTPCTVSAVLYLPNDTRTSVTTGSLRTDTEYTVQTIRIDVPHNIVDVWWPNGYGEQPLYELRVVLATKGNTSEKTIRLGFRTIELVEDPLEKGRTFYFRVNHVPVFAKGSNFIPSSVFPEHGANEETIRHLLLSSKAANMNMLRVWGGGIYESGLFYDLADQYGLMIWQDFMFACSMYPTDQPFLDSVREEVVQNVNRLKNHPSVVVWAGNNENEAALYGNWYGTGTAKVYRDDYLKLYVDLIKKEVERLDRTRPFVVSSPGNGVEYSKEYNYVGENPYSVLYGDVHYYNYIKNGWDINVYPRARFSSEYGVQSLPSIYTMATATTSVGDLSTNSDFMRHRQHLPLGRVYMQGMVSKNFHVPSTNDSLRDFVDTIYLSQVNQAVTVKVETEFYRQARSEVDETGAGMTMGALYWQLNDVWQAPSWSSIDFSGRWKMLHYYAKDFFAPVIVASKLSEARDLSLYVVSDKLQAIDNATLHVNVHKWDSMTPVYKKSYEDFTIGANKAIKIDEFWLDEFLSTAGCGPATTARLHCILTLTLVGDDGTLLAPTNYVYPTAIKNVNLPAAVVSVKINDYHRPGRYSNYPDFEIEVTTDNVALFVWLETANIRGRFSENGFHMFEAKKSILFHAEQASTPRELFDSLTVTSVSHVYDSSRIDYVKLVLRHS